MPELDGMPLLRRGQRLSVQPVDDVYWNAIMRRIDG
jgi:predicted RNA-binding protein with PUA-like domain